MLFEHKRKTSVTALFSLVLYILFTVLSLTLVYTGVKAYQRTTQISQQNEQLRSSVSYVTNKLRNAEGSVAIVDYDGIKVLQIEEREGDFNYFTNLYFYEGYLRETMSDETFEFDPTLGEEIIALHSFDITQNNDKYIVITTCESVFLQTVSTCVYREAGFGTEG